MNKVENKIERLANVSNEAAEVIAFSNPYSVQVTVVGSADILFHRWNPEAVDEKAKAAKNSKAKKSDDVQSYVYRDTRGFLAIPGEYLRCSLINAAKFRQDPRSPRKSAADLFKAAIVVITPMASLGVKDWDFLHRGRVTVQRQGINRTRPALRAGWKATFELMVVLPEYIDRHALRETIESAGRLIGIGDFRPSYGRFGITAFKDL